jgi:hypothetical protein
MLASTMYFHSSGTTWLNDRPAIVIAPSATGM